MLMQHYGTIENHPFRGPLYIHSNSPREKILNNNNKHGPSTKDINKNKDKSKKIGLTQEIITRPRPKSNSVLFGDPHDHIHHMDHHYENTHLIDTQEQKMKKIRLNKMNSMTRKMMN